MIFDHCAGSDVGPSLCVCVCVCVCETKTRTCIKRATRLWCIAVTVCMSFVCWSLSMRLTLNVSKTWQYSCGNTHWFRVHKLRVDFSVRDSHACVCVCVCACVLRMAWFVFAVTSGGLVCRRNLSRTMIYQTWLSILRHSSQIFREHIPAVDWPFSQLPGRCPPYHITTILWCLITQTACLPIV